MMVSVYVCIFICLKGVKTPPECLQWPGLRAQLRLATRGPILVSHMGDEDPDLGVIALPFSGVCFSGKLILGVQPGLERRHSDPGYGLF